jgi:hypothetical protein
MLRSGPGVSPHVGSTFIGVGLVLLGSVSIGVAAWQHGSFCKTLQEGELPRGYTVRWSVGFAIAIAVIGLVLAVYLLLRGNGS